MTLPEDPVSDFPDIPSFPTDVETAPLLRISLQKLIDNDLAETSRLWQACCDVGFFYLDLQNAHGTPPSEVNGHDVNGNDATNGHFHTDTVIDGNTFLEDATKLFGVAEEFFDLSVEEKAKYDFKARGSYHGYKGYGAGMVDKAGTKDRNEFYNTSKDDIFALSVPPLPAPTCLTPYRLLFSSYMATSHAIIRIILYHLNTQLHLPIGTLNKLHAFETMSGDQVRFVKAPPQPPQDSRAALGAHTDFGSMTLLFNRLGGLQILPPISDSLSEDEKADMWQYVRPLKGHCIVNLGDAMVKFTRGILRSNIHRVVNPPGEQAKSVRYSLVYFSRPNEDVILRPLENSDLVAARKSTTADDEAISSKDWVLKRALGRRGNIDDFNKSGGTEDTRKAKEISVT